MKEEFRVLLSSSPLSPYVKNYWLLKMESNSSGLARTVPTGMMNLIFHRANRIFSTQKNEFHPRAFLNGQEKSFDDLHYTGEINMISVAFNPIGIRAFFNLPINRLNNIRVTAEEVSDKELLELERTITSTESDQCCILMIERFLLKRFTGLTEHNLKRVKSAIHLINSGITDVGLLAENACLSKKQFQRVFSEYVGVNPKEFSRKIRFQRALHILETKPEISFTNLSYECGYFDQSHLIKEFKALSGYTPGEYLSVCTPYSDYFN